MKRALKLFFILATVALAKPVHGQTLQLIHETTGTYNSAKAQNAQIKLSTGGFNVMIATTATISSSGTANNFTLVGSSATNFSANNSKIINISSGSIASDVARFSQVKVLQVLTYTLTAASATTTTSFVATSLSGAITPQGTSSKIFVVVDGTLSTVNLSQGANATILRNGTNIAAAGGLTGMVSAGVVTDGIHVPCHMSILDSPSSSSAVTYAVGIKTGGAGTATWNSASIGATSTMTLIEVNGL